jgi:hypothetical protein
MKSAVRLNARNQVAVTWVCSGGSGQFAACEPRALSDSYCVSVITAANMWGVNQIKGKSVPAISTAGRYCLSILSSGFSYSGPLMASSNE